MVESNRKRIKISTTLDPELLGAVDRFFGQHPGSDRSAILDEAIMLWLAQEQDRAMAEQYAGEGPPDHEAQAWRSIQRAAAQRIFDRDR